MEQDVREQVRARCGVEDATAVADGMHGAIVRATKLAATEE